MQVRRTFIGRVGAMVSVFVTGGTHDPFLRPTARGIDRASGPGDRTQGDRFGDVGERPPRLALDLVRQFVAKSHGDRQTVQTLLKREPALITAAWDWGGGDWETGLSAASHMGRRDIARLLLDHGAVPNLFTASMLGLDRLVGEMRRASTRTEGMPKAKPHWTLR